MSKLKTVKTLKKSPPMVSETRSKNDEAEFQFQVELCWCIHKLENSLKYGNMSKKLEEDTHKNLKILKSTTAPLVKKRQVMKAVFGDYRTKMKDEERKNALKTKQIKFTSKAESEKKSSFVKRAAILTSGKGFRFDFEHNEDEKRKDLNSVAKSSTDNFPTSNVGLKNDYQFTQSSGFKFNFKVEDENDNFNLNSLCIHK